MARSDGLGRALLVVQRFALASILAASASITLALLGPAVSTSAKAQQATQAALVRSAPGDPLGRYYVGSEPCRTCHAGDFQEFKHTMMGRLQETGQPTKVGKMECETCHGPGSSHVNNGGGRNDIGAGVIRSFRKDDPRSKPSDINAVCLTCHEKGDRTYWQGSTHQTRNVACTSCHTVMKRTSPKMQLAKTNVMDTCFQCHKDRRAQSVRTAHMPMREGKMDCGDCHNPHGGPNEKMLRGATVNDTCYTCHADKRGPFLFEHPPVRENCLNCHEPHGSMNRNLLVVMRPRLCQRCHTPGRHNGNPALGPAANRFMVNSSCQNCHTNIHGSNSPSGRRWHR
ncbi:DmsE family decaheme c-type cytochrome [Afifella pfennigii]|uniref:DmsE family decaheme c-type cytochrome n=1 Tax=Afifella pfennigii TaxID=209897 RepID=UPI001FE21AEA|nr:DmsE family decaheme c-type cytochrome [Afifella pfennigii]